MKKILTYSFLFLLFYIFSVILLSPFLISFGERSLSEQIFIYIINFPVPLNVNITFYPYITPIILNGLFLSSLIYYFFYFKKKWSTNRNIDDEILDK